MYTEHTYSYFLTTFYSPAMQKLTLLRRCGQLPLHMQKKPCRRQGSSINRELKSALPQICERSVSATLALIGVFYSQTSSAEYGMLPQPGYGPPCFSFSPRSPPVISKYLPTRVFSTMAQELPHTLSGSPFIKR